MNWGKKILFFYLLFVAGIAFLVVKSMSQNEDLVTDDYYKQELKFQDKIDQSERTRQLKDSVKIITSNDNLTIKFPDDFKGHGIKGNIHVYCPNDEKLDKIQNFNIEDDNLNVEVSYPYHGLRTLKIEWEVDALSYYNEQKIFL